MPRASNFKRLDCQTCTKTRIGRKRAFHALSNRSDLLVCDEQTSLGVVRRLATRKFLAIDTNGMRVGILPTQLAAMRALPRITEQSKKKPARGMHPRGPDFSPKARPANTKLIERGLQAGRLSR